jgi:PadR family transcriptional regulator PadR
MGHRGEHRRGWQEEPLHGGGPHRHLWREYLQQCLGQPPEQHWFFGGRRLMQWICGPGSPQTINPFVGLLLSKGGGLLPLYVLHLLAEQPRYGNDIMREIETRTNGRWSSNPGAIYPLLTFMESQGLVEGEWEQPLKRTRRFYRITERGRNELYRLKEVLRPGLEDALAALRRLLEDLYPSQEAVKQETLDTL